jgi:hypothetical protein
MKERGADLDDDDVAPNGCWGQSPHTSCSGVALYFLAVASCGFRQDCLCLFFGYFVCFLRRFGVLDVDLGF